jgi:hypothetical protein
MKNRIPLLFIISFIIAFIGGMLKLNGIRTSGNAIMLIGAGLQIITFGLWLFKSRSSKGNEAKS